MPTSATPERVPHSITCASLTEKPPSGRESINSGSLEC